VSPREEIGELAKRLDRAAQALLAQQAQRLLEEPDGRRADLLGVLEQLDEEQISRILEVARAMARPIEEHLDTTHGLVTPEFAREMRSRLQAHHATHDTPLDRLGFENAFLAASRAAGRATESAPSKTTRFWDALVDDAHIALKTEGALSMKADFLHISKLSEAAWIQDVRSARTRREKTFELVSAFLKIVDAVFVFRSYSKELTPHYELVEIPVDHFRRVLDVPVAAFDSDAPKIMIRDDLGPIMEFRLDRSDSKITVAKISKARCRLHADWRLVGLEAPVVD
jgi:hypothetical protein